MRDIDREGNQHWWSGSGRVFGQPPGSDPDGPSRQVSRDPNLIHLAIGIAGLLLLAAIAFGVWQP